MRPGRRVGDLTMATRGGGGVHREDRPRHAEGKRRHAWRFPAGRSTVLAVWLTTLMLVSVFAVPATGALSETGSSVDPGPDPDRSVYAKGGQSGGNGNGGGATSSASSGSSNGGSSSTSDPSSGGSGGSSGSNAESSDGGSASEGSDGGTSSSNGSGDDSGSARSTAEASSSSENGGEDSAGGGAATGSDTNSPSKTDGNAPSDGKSDGTSKSAATADAGGTSSADSRSEGKAKGRTRDDGRSGSDGNAEGRTNDNGKSESQGKAKGREDDDRKGRSDGDARAGRDDRRGPDRSDGPRNGGPPDEPPRGNDAASGTPDDRSEGAGPTVEVSVGPRDDRDWSAAEGRRSARGGSAGDEPSSAVSVSVEGVRAGESVSVDVSPPSVEGDDVAFDGVSATVNRDGDFSLEITASREALPGSPAFQPGDGADALGRIRLEHSIPNEEVEDVSYRFRVSKDRLRATDTDPENVALYRHAEGSWNALPTDVVGETSSHYLLEADSPGMPEFAVGAQRPSFETWWAGVSEASVDAGGSTTISGRVTNDGRADGVYEASLVVDGTVVETQRVTVAAGGTRQVNFERTFDRPGTYHVTVDGVEAGEVSVSEGEEEAPSADRTLSVGMDLLLELGRSVVPG